MKINLHFINFIRKFRNIFSYSLLFIFKILFNPNLAFYLLTFVGLNFLTIQPILSKSTVKLIPSFTLSYTVNSGMYPLRESFEWNHDSGSYKFFHKEKNIEKILGEKEKNSIYSVYKQLIEIGLGNIKKRDNSSEVPAEVIADKSFKSITISTKETNFSIEEDEVKYLTEKEKKIVTKSFKIMSEYCKNFH